MIYYLRLKDKNDLLKDELLLFDSLYYACLVAERCDPNLFVSLKPTRPEDYDALNVKIGEV